MAALPCWLDAVTDDNPMVRDARVAYRFGHFLGARSGREPHLIWVLGGDAWQKGRNVDTPSRLALVRAMAEGLAVVPPKPSKTPEGLTFIEQAFEDHDGHLVVLYEIRQ